MHRFHHGAALVGALLVLVSLGSTWWVISPAGAVETSVSGFESAPALVALFLAVAASYGASLLSTGVFRRVLSALYAGLALAAAWSLAILLRDPRGSLESLVTTITGLQGHGAWEGVQLVGPSSAVVLTAVGLFGLVLSGAVGVFRSDRASSSNRYTAAHSEPSSPGDSVSTWDDLSRGEDPTSR